MDYKNKYLKYKQKYIDLKKQTAGVYFGKSADGSLIDIDDLMFYKETAKSWSIKQAFKFSLLSTDTRRFVAEMPWDFYNTPIPNGMSLNQFSNLFPKAVGLCIARRLYIVDADFQALERMPKLRKLDMSFCNQPTITDAAFTHFRNLTSLDMDYCNQPTITDNAFTHLINLKRLNMNYCNQPTITDAAFTPILRANLVYLSMTGCDQDTITRDMLYQLSDIDLFRH